MLTRKDFDQSLENSRQKLQEMTDAVCLMVLDAVEGAVTDQPDLLQSVIDRDNELDEFERKLIEDVFQLVVLRSPVGKDARFLASVFSIASELENAGDDAVKLARRASKIQGEFPGELQAPLGALAESVVQMLHDAMALTNVYTEQRADEIIASDEHIDSAYKKARRHIMNFTEATGGTLTRDMFRMIEIFHALEHIADHAVEIAKRLKSLNRDLFVVESDS